jgi:hypothetical protein
LLFTGVRPKKESNVLTRPGVLTMEKEVNKKRLQACVESGEVTAVVSQMKIS